MEEFNGKTLYTAIHDDVFTLEGEFFLLGHGEGFKFPAIWRLATELEKEIYSNTKVLRPIVIIKNF